MTEWLNRADVRAALNIQSDNRFNSADNGVGMNYTLTEPNVLPIYEHARQKDGLRVLVYNGDTDPGINSMVTQRKYVDYFDSINVTETEAWRPWTTDGKQRMGGYVISYPGDFHYLTIRGSGHMVPEYKPDVTLAFIAAFVGGKPFQPYVKPPMPRRGQRGRGDLFPDLRAGAGI
jgi:serine carboxypeptidase-like clade I